MRARLAWAAIILAWVALAGSQAGAEPTYDEPYRPQFHFTAAKGWLNDPNGLVYENGEYHLFFQHNPHGNNWVFELSWGHAVSKDLVHWQQLPPTIPPTPIPGKGGVAGSWSGSALIDKNNTAGFATGNEPPIIVVWTAANLGQCIAYSNDHGRTFTPYSGNPVLPGDKTGDWDRDPKVYWNDTIHRWTMAISISGKGFAFYTSPDLKKWILESELPGLFECPDYFELPVQGKPGETRWIAWDASSKYLIGRFDGRKFTPEAGPFQLDSGHDYYAAQTWNNAPEHRRISIGWLRDGKFPGMPFNGEMGVPSELSLRATPDGIRLAKVPVHEIEQLRYDEESVTDKPLDTSSTPLAGRTGDTFDIEAEIEPRDAEVVFNVRGLEVRYANNTLQVGKHSAPASPIDGKLKLRVLVDRTSVEAFANDGLASISTNFLPNSSDQKLALSAGKGTAHIVSLKTWRMRSAWNSIDAAKEQSRK